MFGFLTRRKPSTDEISDAVQKWSDASETSASAEADACMALVQQVANRVGGAVIGYDGTGKVFMHPELVKALEQPENAGVRETMDVIVEHFRREPPPQK